MIDEFNANQKNGTSTFIHKGDIIGTESNQGIDAIHTHVEVRNGKKERAAVSSDSELVNEDPTEYLESKGYIIK